MFPRIPTWTVAIAFAAALAGCSGGTPHPKGWTAAPTASPDLWSKGTQTYRYAKRSFDGTLQDLASQQVANVVLRYRGTRFDRSTTFPPCPGVAAIATFRYGPDRILIQGFAVQGDQEVLVTYIRPLNTTIDPAVRDALRQALCVAPG